eukprot:scaffold121595_cov29-Tisochrysis_lutea.AAC.1
MRFSPQGASYNSRLPRPFTHAHIHSSARGTNNNKAERAQRIRAGERNFEGLSTGEQYHVSHARGHYAPEICTRRIRDALGVYKVRQRCTTADTSIVLVQGH